MSDGIRDAMDRNRRDRNRREEAVFALAHDIIHLLPCPCCRGLRACDPECEHRDEAMNLRREEVYRLITALWVLDNTSIARMREAVTGSEP